MGSKVPFEHVVTRHGATVLRVCRAVVGPDDADDAWSETFLAALHAYPDLPDDANLEAWLVTIAHRKAIDLLRARSRRPVAVGQVPDRRPPDENPADDHEHVWAALQALPTKQRQAVAYHYLGGLPYLEVAAILGGTPAAARRAAADGMGTLRRRLPHANDEGGAR